ncbi:MAG: sugar phosphate nucleotidyltransferase [Oligoflexia bacterium]|nr:sugar phosphate nucleotidyltransferase [Oligoflexia bacterium]
MRAFILSAGLGTRLKPLTDSMPKPLVPVLGKPMIFYTLNLLEKNGFTEALVNVHYFADQMRTFIRDWNQSDHKLKITIQDEEPKLLGSGGGLLKASEWLFAHEDTAMICNADVIYDPDIRALIKQHKVLNQKQGVLCTLLLMKHKEAGIKYGGVEVHDNLITGFGKEKEKKYLHFPGMYLIEKQVFQNTNLKVSDFSVREEIWKPLVRKKQLGYLEYQKFYYDLGTPQDLKIAEAELEKISF